MKSYIAKAQEVEKEFGIDELLNSMDIDDYILPKESTVESIVDLIKKDC